MIERPILFQSPLVRAILPSADGTPGSKTRTRRLVRRPARASAGEFAVAMEEARQRGWPGAQKRGPEDGIEWRCGSPYGVPGDRLWVRETWHVRGLCHTLPISASKAAAPDAFVYAATPPAGWAGGWRPSIHMPRWASRLTLALDTVRVERLQDITEEDARAEGIPLNTVAPEKWTPNDGYLTPAGLANAERGEDCDEDGMTWRRGRRVPAWTTDAREAFAALWDSLAPEGSRWDDNPWVWVLGWPAITGGCREG